jgi:hypothetical protein
MSMLAALDGGTRQRGTDRLRASIESGDWEQRFGHLRVQSSIDLGYRLIVAGGSQPG